MRDPSCIFCAIVASEAEASVLARSDEATAFLDLHPFRPGHALVVPNEHVPDFEDLPDELLASVVLLCKRIARAQKRLYSTEKIGLVVAGFDVPHAHFHVLPMHEHHDLTSQRVTDGLVTRAGREELDTVAAQLREAMRNLG